MRVDELAPAPGSNRRPKRVGRGIGGKGGKTAGRGTKGQHARGRGKVARGFEGGQMPLKQRVPKLKGFNNPFRVEYTAINFHAIERAGLTEVTPETLVAAGLLRKGDYAKVLAYGELTTAINVSVHAVSKTAAEAIAARGGSVTIIPMPFTVRPAANGNQFTNR
ncbi:MAG TPA: 50S ribosomal protein L15 [Ilumatobacteraceae bacterium]|nr:50S ribosomal protein L15 [Ilumatobacteraceae bacterium]